VATPPPVTVLPWLALLPLLPPLPIQQATPTLLSLGLIVWMLTRRWLLMVTVAGQRVHLSVDLGDPAAPVPCSRDLLRGARRHSSSSSNSHSSYSHSNNSHNNSHNNSNRRVRSNSSGRDCSLLAPWQGRRGLHPPTRRCDQRCGLPCVLPPL
jgi:hypothetical protein